MFAFFASMCVTAYNITSWVCNKLSLLLTFCDGCIGEMSGCIPLCVIVLIINFYTLYRLNEQKKLSVLTAAAVR